METGFYPTVKGATLPAWPQKQCQGEGRRANSRTRFCCYNARVPIPDELLELIVCPVCRKPLTLRPDDSLKCNECKRVYPIRNGIPILLEHEASIDTL